ncbi:DNA-binding transcriptional LysR family regulator [Streptacidiphilus sp. MAP12-20]
MALSLEVALSAELLRQLADDALDVAVVAVDPAAADAVGVRLEHLLDEPVLVALPPGHPLAGLRDVRLTQLAEEDWIAGSSRPEDTLLGSALRAGFRPRIGYVVADWFAKQGLVAAGFGVTLVPALAAGALRPDLALATVHPDDVPIRAIHSATPRGLTASPELAAFLSAAASGRHGQWAILRPTTPPMIIARKRTRSTVTGSPSASMP